MRKDSYVGSFTSSWRPTRCVSLLGAALLGTGLFGAVACQGNIGSSTGSGGTSGSIDETIVDTPLPEGFEPAQAIAARLTKEQYLNTINDLFGVDLSLDAELLPAEERRDGFSNLAVHLTVFSEHPLAYSKLSEMLPEKMSQFSEWVQAHSACQDESESCRRSLVEGMILPVFRRPAEPFEITEFTALLNKISAEGLGFDDSAKWLLSALLQSPQFLYRLEAQTTGNAGQREIRAYEMASRLSYLIWQSAPDAELLNAAAQGKLETRDDVIVQVDRLFADEKAKRATRRFIQDWMNLDHLADPGTQREALTPELRVELSSTVVAFYQDHIWTQALPLHELWTSKTAFLTPTMTEWYGLSSKGAGIQQYDTTELENRSGLLTQPGVMAGMADRDVGGMVARGLFMEEHIFCGRPTPPPPATIDLAANMAHLGEMATQRAYSEDRLSRAECKACHDRFEPLAFAFERFDGVGRYNAKDEFGNELKTDGWVPAAVDGVRSDYQDPIELMKIISNSAAVQNCVTKKQIDFSINEALGYKHEAILDEIRESAESSGGDYQSYLKAIISHAIFRVIPTE